MLKKYFISFLPLIAYAVILAHSVTPHHHHRDTIVHSQQSSDDDHDDINHNLFEDAFSFFQHGAENELVYEHASSSFNISKTDINQDVFLFVQKAFQLIFKPPLVHTEQKSFLVASSFYYAKTLFRGPPTLMA